MTRDSCLTEIHSSNDQINDIVNCHKFINCAPGRVTSNDACTRHNNTCLASIKKAKLIPKTSKLIEDHKREFNLCKSALKFRGTDEPPTEMLFRDIIWEKKMASPVSWRHAFITLSTFRWMTFIYICSSFPGFCGCSVSFSLSALLVSMLTFEHNSFLLEFIIPFFYDI